MKNEKAFFSSVNIVSAPDDTADSKSLHSDKRQRFSVKALHDSVHLLKGNMMEIINVVRERAQVLVCVYVCPSLRPSVIKHKWKRHYCPQTTDVIRFRRMTTT